MHNRQISRSICCCLSALAAITMLIPLEASVELYADFFVGIDRSVPATDATGLLKNMGINSESDVLVGFPYLDDSGQNAYGGAIGLRYLFDLQQQLVFEDKAERRLSDSSNSFDDEVDNQYSVGMRYQNPTSKA